MSITTAVSKIISAKNAIAEAIRSKGVSVPATAKLSEYAEYVSQLPAFSLYTAYNIYGNSVQIGTPSPENPVGINSTGKKEGKLIMQSAGKNLFDKSAVGTHAALTKLDNGFQITNSYGTSTGAFPTSKTLAPNTTYTISVTVTVVSGTTSASYGRISLYSPKTSSFFHLITGGNAGNIKQTVTTPSNIADYTNLYFYATATGVMTFTNIQIEYGATATNYEMFTEPVIEEIPLAEPLRGLPNGAADDFGYKKIKEITFNGVGQTWSVYSSSETLNPLNIGFVTTISDSVTDSSIASGGKNALSNLLKKEPGSASSGTAEGIYNSETAGAWYFVIQKMRLVSYGFLDSMTTAQKTAVFNLWLADNNLTLQYQLLTPIARSITRPKIAYLGGALTCLSEVQPSRITYEVGGQAYINDITASAARAETLQLLDDLLDITGEQPQLLNIGESILSALSPEEIAVGQLKNYTLY